MIKAIEESFYDKVFKNELNSFELAMIVSFSYARTILLEDLEKQIKLKFRT